MMELGRSESVAFSHGREVKRLAPTVFVKVGDQFVISRANFGRLFFFETIAVVVEVFRVFGYGFVDWRRRTAFRRQDAS